MKLASRPAESSPATTPPPSRRPLLWGTATIVRDDRGRLLALELDPRRLAFAAGLTLLAIYGAGVGGLYSWLRYARDLDALPLWTVATLDRTAVRAEMGRVQLAQARAALAAKEHRRALFLAQGAVRQAPRRSEARVFLADLLHTFGRTPMADATLLSGLDLAPDDALVTDRLLASLLRQGREAEVIALVARLLPHQPAQEREAALRTCELLARLTSGGARDATAYLEAHPTLRAHPDAQAVIARVWWASGRRGAATTLLETFAQAHPERLEVQMLLVDYLLAQQQRRAARAVADAARARHPDKSAAALLALAARGPTGVSPREWRDEVARFLREFGGEDRAVLTLAEMAGDNGWSDLARELYRGSAASGEAPTLFALHYCSALARAGDWRDAAADLEQLAHQVAPTSPMRAPLLEQQMRAAHALGRTSLALAHAEQLRTQLGGSASQLQALARQLQAEGLGRLAAVLLETAPQPSEATVASVVR